MAEQRPLPTTFEAFDRARGEELDGVWAFGLSWSLMRRDVEVTLVDEGLREALAVVRETQESPKDLFGAPHEHADVLYERWRSEGRLVLDDGRTGWRDAIATGLVLSALWATALVVLLGSRGEMGTWTLARAVAISLVVGVGSAVGHALWSRRHLRPAPGPDVPDDARWSMELTQILRSRYAMSGERVRDIVAEAHAHAQEADRPVRDEFGTPEEYAARFAPDLRRRSRWRTAALAALAVIGGLLFLDGFRWTTAAMTALFVWWAVHEHRVGRVSRAR